MAPLGDPVKVPPASSIGEPPPVTAAPVKDPLSPPLLSPTSTPEKKTPESAPAIIQPPVVARTPASRPSSSGALPVESHREADYTVKQGDTFASISKANYAAEDYAEALRQYNQTDPLRNVPLIEKDGILQAGQLLLIPDRLFLEQRYSNLLPKKKTTTEPPLSPSGKLTPVPAPPDTTIRTVAASSAMRYMVPAGGQSMREIARLTLGDGERWSEIFRLNPSLRPDWTIPAGTALTLPPDAKVPGGGQLN